jgi:capsular exopolysaccharide synthesis family protein
MITIERLREDSLLSAEINKLESRLWRQCRREDLKTVLITSAIRGEGKSTTAAYLATALALFPGRKILAMDFDLRVPSLNRQIRAEIRHGIEDVLAGKIEVKNAIAKTGLEGLDVVVPSGKADPELLHQTETMRRCFAYARANYDMVLIDTPAVIPVADATALMPFADGVMLVAMAGKTTEPYLRRALTICEGLDARMLGLVVGNVHEAAPEYLVGDYNYYYE